MSDPGDDLPDDLEIQARETVERIQRQRWEDGTLQAEMVEWVWHLTERIRNVEMQNRELRALLKKHLPDLPEPPAVRQRRQ